MKLKLFSVVLSGAILTLSLSGSMAEEMLSKIENSASLSTTSSVEEKPLLINVGAGRKTPQECVDQAKKYCAAHSDGSFKFAQCVDWQYRLCLATE